MSYKGVNYEPLYKVGYLAAIILAVVLIATFQPFAKPPPTNARAYGCYVADAAPPIRLDQEGMHILQAGFPRIGYHLEWHKTAITLTADAPIEAIPSGGEYRYSMYSPGEGWYLDFQHFVDGRYYGEFDETKLAMFAMLAQDGRNIIYSKSSSSGC